MSSNRGNKVTEDFNKHVQQAIDELLRGGTVLRSSDDSGHLPNGFYVNGMWKDWAGHTIPEQDKPEVAAEKAEVPESEVLYEKAKKFFFGENERPKHFISQAHCSVHNWVEVTIFHTPHLRCSMCDIKKTDVGGSK